MSADKKNVQDFIKKAVDLMPATGRDLEDLVLAIQIDQVGFLAGITAEFGTLCSHLRQAAHNNYMESKGNSGEPWAVFRDKLDELAKTYAAGADELKARKDEMLARLEEQVKR